MGGMGEALPALLWAPWACQAHGRAPDGAGTGRRGVSPPWDLTWAGNQDRHVPPRTPLGQCLPTSHARKQGCRTAEQHPSPPGSRGGRTAFKPCRRAGPYSARIHLPLSPQLLPAAAQGRVDDGQEDPVALSPIPAPAMSGPWDWEPRAPPSWPHPFHVRATRQTAHLPASPPHGPRINYPPAQRRTVCPA